MPPSRHQRPKTEPARCGSINGILIGILLVAAIGAGWFALGLTDDQSTSQTELTKTRHSAAWKLSAPGSQEPVAKFPITIRKPAGPPRVTTGLTDASGDLITVSCSTCHSTRQANFKNRSTKDLDEFHLNMTFAHGTTSCLSCHNANDYDALKLADGQRVEFTDVMTLCAQCHGPQKIDYEHGVHGGMNGYWDLTRGPRTRNNCVDCHNPHAPQFPSMQPTFKPRDRFLDQNSHSP